MSGKGSPGDSNSKSMMTVVESCPEPVIIKSKSKKKAAGGADKKKPAATPTVTKEMIGKASPHVL